MKEELVLPPRIKRVLAIYAEDHGVTVGLICGPSQTANVVMARRKSIHTLRSMGLSMPEIARFLKKHHTSVLNALNQPLRDPKTRKITAAPYKERRFAELIPVPDWSGEWAI